MSAYSNLVNLYSEDVVAPLVAESDDWEDHISPALDELRASGYLPKDPDRYNVLLVLMNVIYALGYYRGQQP